MWRYYPYKIIIYHKNVNINNETKVLVNENTFILYFNITLKNTKKSKNVWKYFQRWPSTVVRYL